MIEGKSFDSNVFFSGGAGMFLQYHDVVKPTYLFAIIKMILTNETYGLPISIIDSFSILSIIEWYIRRRYINPYRCLDYNHQCDPTELDDLLYKSMNSDSSIYTLSTPLNIKRMIDASRSHHMTFPIYVYTEREEPAVKDDVKSIFGKDTVYVHGDLKSCIQRCDQNFTYIFSDIEMVKKASEILIGTCSHILLTRDFRYNYRDNYKTFRYDLLQLQTDHPFCRIGTTLSLDMNQLAISLSQILPARKGVS